MFTLTAAFNRNADAELAIQALHDAGFALDTGPSSEHTIAADDTGALATPSPAFDVSPTPAQSAGAEQAPRTAATGITVGGTLGFIVGLGALPVLGPVAPLAGVGVGAYGGSLIGALKGMQSAEDAATRGDEEHAPDDARTTVDRARIERGEGSVITIAAYSADGRVKANDILWSCGAVSVTDGDASSARGTSPP